MKTSGHHSNHGSHSNCINLKFAADTKKEIISNPSVPVSESYNKVATEYRSNRLAVKHFNLLIPRCAASHSMQPTQLLESAANTGHPIFRAFRAEIVFYGIALEELGNLDLVL